MATQGYECNFSDSVPDYLYCKKCALVARKISITTCCGESFCHACISNYQKEGKPCPTCGENDYTCVGHKKNQKQIASLQVYCSVKERGCGWLGTLEQLDTHLDPDQDNCQYVDTKCPLNCCIAIPKNKVEQHVAQHCAKRPYVCLHCNFKATFEEVEKHLAECKYVPLQCPNMCGVTFERDFMEDHMKMCRLQEVKCEFSKVGCDDRFAREDQDEHIRNNSQKHLALTACIAVESKEHLQQKLLEQSMKNKEEKEALKQKIQEQAKKIGELEKKLEVQDREGQKIHQRLNEQERKLLEQKKCFKELKQLHTMQEQKINEELEKNVKRYRTLRSKLKKQIDILSRVTAVNYSFVMKKFNMEKAKDEPGDWMSPAMYTHVGGYKFCIGVDANGEFDVQGDCITAALWSMPGEYDSELEWPVTAEFTLELINQKGGKNTFCTDTFTWRKKRKFQYVDAFERDVFMSTPYFLEHSEIADYLLNGTLYFNVSVRYVI